MHAENLDSFLFGMRSTPSFRTHLISEQNAVLEYSMQKRDISYKGKQMWRLFSGMGVSDIEIYWTLMQVCDF